MQDPKKEPKLITFDWEVGVQRLDGTLQLWLLLACVVIPLVHYTLHKFLFTVRLHKQLARSHASGLNVSFMCACLGAFLNVLVLDHYAQMPSDDCATDAQMDVVAAWCKTPGDF